MSTSPPNPPEASAKLEPTRAKLYSTIRRAIDAEARRLNTPYTLVPDLLKAAVESLIVEFGWDPSEERDRLNLRVQEIRIRLLAALCEDADPESPDDPRAATDLVDCLHGERDSLRAKLKEAEAALRTLADCDVDEDRSTVPELLAMIVADREHVRKEAEKRAETAEGETERLREAIRALGAMPDVVRDAQNGTIANLQERVHGLLAEVEQARQEAYERGRESK